MNLDLEAIRRAIQMTRAMRGADCLPTILVHADDDIPAELHQVAQDEGATVDVSIDVEPGEVAVI